MDRCDDQNTLKSEECFMLQQGDNLLLPVLLKVRQLLYITRNKCRQWWLKVEHCFRIIWSSAGASGGPGGPGPLGEI